MIPPGWGGIAYIPSQSWPRYFFYQLDQSCRWGQPSFLLLGNRKLNLALESLQTFLPLSLCTWVCLNSNALRKCSMTWVRIQTTEDEPNPTLEPWWHWPQILTYGGLAGESRLTNDRNHDWLSWHHGWLNMGIVPNQNGCLRSTGKQRMITAKEMLSTLGYPCRPQTANQLQTVTCQQFAVLKLFLFSYQVSQPDVKYVYIYIYLYYKIYYITLIYIYVKYHIFNIYIYNII